VYALLFADAGLSTAQISVLFAIWSASGFVLEIPSGVWADAVSRRLLLALAPLLSGLGWALWVLAPSFEVFALGFVLWGAQGALQSGAFEALVYDELDARGDASRYATVIGRATACGTAASAAAMGLASPVFASGGYEAVGAASVAACVLAALVGWSLPESRATPDGERSSYRQIVGEGWHEVRSSPRVRRALVAVAAVTAVWGSLDEYLPLLAVEGGAAPEAVPLLGLLVYAGVAAGGLLGGVAARVPARPVVLVAAGLLAAGALLRSPAGFALIAVAFCLFQAAQIAVDARLQDAITSDARSTVTSVAGLVTEIAVIAVFAAYGLGSTLTTHATLFALAAGTYLLTSRVIDARPASEHRAGA
jgi:MFS family permease